MFSRVIASTWLPLLVWAALIEAALIGPGAPLADAQEARSSPRPEPDASASRPAAGQGPALQLAAEDGFGGEGRAETAAGGQDTREGSPGTLVGGYGELHYGLRLARGAEDAEAEVDLHRLVLFLGHRFTNELRFYAEVELEHALSGGDLPGEVGVEQAYVEWRPAEEGPALRAGIVLVPMGLVNRLHEPPSFNGVERPRLDRTIIPSTWREPAIGVVGEPMPGLRYEAYVLGGLDPLGFRTVDGIRQGRQGAAEARADGLALAARVEVEPALGFVAGLDAYASLAGPNAGALRRVVGTDPLGAPVLRTFEPAVPVVGLSADARLHTRGIEARAVCTYWSIGDTAALARAVDESGTPLGVDAPSGMLGAYAEFGFDLLSLADTEQSLVPFARLEWNDPTFRHRDGALQGSAASTDLVMGVSYLPVPQVVAKGDVVLRAARGARGQTILHLGLGWTL